MSSVMSAFSTLQLTQSTGAEVGRLRSHYTCCTVYFCLELRIGYPDHSRCDYTKS